MSIRFSRLHTISSLIALLLLSVGLASAQGLHVLRCASSGPDSVFFDKNTFNRYLPGEFDILVNVWNDGGIAADSLVAFPRSNPRFTVVSPPTVLLAERALPGDSMHAVFRVRVNPRAVSGLDTLYIAVTGKDGARTDCMLVIWVEKEYKPVNVLTCPPLESIVTVFVDTLNDYSPNPLGFELRVENTGDAPSRETRLFYVATASLSLADGQPQSIDIGTLPPGEAFSTLFRLNVVRRTTDTTVTVYFRVQGKGGLNDRIIDTVCSYELFIPAVRNLLFDLSCENDPAIRFEDGEYRPNPFRWSVRIRNNGTARAKDVRATLTHPVYVSIVDPLAELLVGDLNPGEAKEVTWTLRAHPVFEADTSQLCVMVFDMFNRRASCCDTLILPAVRAPSLVASCTVIPDTIRVNTATGLYQPAEFLVDLLITNIGTDPADSVYAEIILADPDIQFVEPKSSRILVATSFAPNTQQSVQWTLAPLPVSMPRDIEFILRVTSRNAPVVSTRCELHIAAALKPAFACHAWTTPLDTLHYNIASLEYDGLRFSATLRNNGTIAARDLEAAILLPSGLGLPSSEATLLRRSEPLEVDSIWTVSWTLLPVHRREGTLDTIRVEFRSGALRSYCEDWIFIIGIPPVTVFTIPRYSLERYGREVTAPILIDESQHKDIQEINLHISYDASLVELIALETENTLLADGWSVIGNTQPGQLSILALSQAGPLTGTGELLHMRFKVLFGDGDDILRHAGTLLQFDTVRSSVNRGSILARFYDGYVTVSGDCLYPLEANENFVIFDNRPNPFNPSTVLGFELRRSGFVTIQLHDASGRRLRILHAAQHDSGRHEFTLHATDLPSGRYYAVLLLDGMPSAERTLLLVR
jgi:hypothetical protein